MWDDYPATYREAEATRLARAARAGECASVVGLSGAGKSNLLGFVAHRADADGVAFALVDGNRLREPTADGLFALAARAVAAHAPAAEMPAGANGGDALERAVDAFFASRRARMLCMLIDRFDAPAAHAGPALFGYLRALRDTHKYRLSFVTATRRPLDPKTEFAELVFANTLWLGCLAESDARWSVARYASRQGLGWDEGVATALIGLTRGYPSLLRAACEAYADLGPSARGPAIAEHPAVRARVEEFWGDAPSDEEIARSGLTDLPLLYRGRPARPAPPPYDTNTLTAKELILLRYFESRPGQVCEKDAIIVAVWTEDKAFVEGIRDESLTQLVRRLREKIEPDPSHPRFVLTVPGRGYRFVPA